MIAPTNKIRINYTQLSFLSRVRSRNRGCGLSRTLTLAAIAVVVMMAAVNGSGWPHRLNRHEPEQTRARLQKEANALRQPYTAAPCEVEGCKAGLLVKAIRAAKKAGHFSIKKRAERELDLTRKTPKCQKCKCLGTGEEAGVQLTGAGNTRLNGWYTRKSAAEGPPRCYSDEAENWAQANVSPYWYEKADGAYIFHEGGSWSPNWVIHRPNDSAYTYRCSYYLPENANPPPAGWTGDFNNSPAPTLRLVNHKKGHHYVRLESLEKLGY